MVDCVKQRFPFVEGDGIDDERGHEGSCGKEKAMDLPTRISCDASSVSK